jgi:phosphotransferase system HPr-like phosphotransfer protein
MGSTLVLRASGPDADQAVAAIARLIESKFGES